VARRVVCLGEIMLRLEAPAHQRLLQSPAFEASFGGSEANVAVSLASFGMPARFVSALPANALGDAALAELRRFGVDVSQVVRSGERVGIYYLEAGSNQRPSKVIYDRAGSSAALADASLFDWSAIFADAGWLHVSGITPALSETAAALTLEACRQAKRHELRISCDFNHRAGLWRYGRSAPEVMTPIVGIVDVGIGNASNCRESLGIEAENLESLAKKVAARFPNLSMLALTSRESRSADRHGWSACLFSEGRLIDGPKYEITDIVDRVGAGDGFAAGLIYGLDRYGDAARALRFATAAGCLKHTIPGDFNRVGAAEVEALMDGRASGRIER
jgi:2-dehydro-3-deoxygluconokinase